MAETFKMLKCLVEQLTWEHSSAFLIQLAFTLGPFLEEVRPPTPVSLLWPLSSKGAAGTVSKASGWRVMPVWGLHRVTWTESRGRWQEWRDALEPEHILWRGVGGSMCTDGGAQRPDPGRRVQTEPPSHARVCACAFLPRSRSFCA